MHRHDLDLMAALADGSLEDETQARARIESCEECRREYESQKAVLAALAAAPPVAMTEQEKAALHRDLWTELRTGGEMAAKTSTPWWYRFSYAAAGLFVVVGLVAVVAQLGGSDQAITEGAAVQETFSEIGSTLEGAGADQIEPAESGESALDADDGQAAAPLAAPELLEELESLRFSASRSADFQADLYEECLTRAELEDHKVVDEIEFGGSVYLVAVPENEPEDSELVSYVEAGTCKVVGAEE